jgi:hypothetical protein
MSKLLDAKDILADARNCVECIFMAAGSLSSEEADPFQVVADMASQKINEAIALLDEYRESKDSAGPVPDAPAAETASRPARTKRSGK